MNYSVPIPESIVRALQTLPNMSVSLGEPLAKRTTWKVGGPADLWLEPESEEALLQVLRILEQGGVPWVVLGKGSNTLASDDGFRGAVLNLERGFTRLEKGPWMGEECQVEVGAGVAIAALLRLASAENLGGIEVLTGVPGTVGGAIRMNAGTHLGDVSDCLVSLRVLRSDQQIEWVPAEEIGLRYRASTLQPDEIVLAARFRARKVEPGVVGSTIREVKERRRQTQPLQMPSGGSTFANAEEERAWKLLDQAGLRGFKEGGAWFSEMHPNFLVQAGEATAQDMKTLIDIAKQRVLDQSGILLREEVSRLEPEGWVRKEQGTW